ncbi:MAG TPA: non-canonical purine NTP pyrophosphatase [Candidatus Nanoarchaeia archaeon]|nr:non-canonical purine NTP pyrophosphatase [Candidatus Nanoarchaeia archaeon]
MVLYFITGNKWKLKEVQAIIPEAEGIDFDLPEIQELDPQKIITEKLKEAVEEKKGDYFVEDTSLYLECLNGFPGPLIKWMLDRLGSKGIYELVSKYNNHSAVAKTVIGYSSRMDIHFFVGELKGKIVAPRGKEGFGWDSIFEVSGRTLAEMPAEEKNKKGMRSTALTKFKKFLNQHG